MKSNFYILILLCILSVSASGQSLWDGGGDGTSWNVAANWADDKVPVVGALCEIGMSATITGAVTNQPGQVKVTNGATVKFALNLTVGDGIIDQHSITLGNNCKVTFGNGSEVFTFNISPKNTKQGLAIFASNDSCVVTVEPGAKLNLFKASQGMNIANIKSTFVNNGTIVIDSSVSVGIKSSGSFVNNGKISGSFIKTDPINVGPGTFMNGVNGVLDFSKPADDGIEIVDRGTLTNAGKINIVLKDNATANNVGIAVGSKDSLGTFINQASGDVKTDGGIGTNGRGFFVYELGEFINSGKITTVGGNPASRIFTRNKFTNDKNGFIDLKDGKINLSMGTLTNNGYLYSTYTLSGISADTLTNVINNGFFRYANSNNIASGSGIKTDNGINAKDSTQTNIDAKGACNVKIANVSYAWSEGTKLIGTSSATGSLSLPPKSLTGKPAKLTTVFDSVFVYIHNYCPEANVAGVEDNIFVWDGGGDNALWQDAKNWDTDVLPTAGSIIEINKSATISGTVALAPASIKIGAKANVTLNLPLTVGDGVVEEHGITLAANSKLSLGDGTTSTVIKINTPATKQGLAIFNSSDTSSVIIGKTTTLELSNSSIGINLSNKTSSITNEGLITIKNSVKTGIKSSSTFRNKVSANISADQPLSDAIALDGGVFTNEGNISCNKAGDDGIEILQATLQNSGAINITVKDNAGVSNNGITIDSLGNLVNGVSGLLDMNGGSSTNARAIVVSDFGSYKNEGISKFNGGNTGSSVYSRGKMENSKGGLFTLNVGRISVNSGTLINNGYIKSQYSGPGIQADTQSVVTNNAFFGYSESNSFASGKGAIFDYGINVNKTLNATKECTIDLGEVSYPWSIGTTSLGNSSDQGKLTFTSKSLTADSVFIKTLYDFTIKVTNICSGAVITGTEDQLLNASVRVFPSVIHSGEVINLMFERPILGVLKATLMDINGTVFGQNIELKPAGKVWQLPIYGTSGLKIVKIQNGNEIMTKKIVILD